MRRVRIRARVRVRARVRTRARANMIFGEMSGVRRRVEINLRAE